MPDPTPLTPDTLGSLLSTLDAGEFTAFVADLWERQGWDVAREGHVLAVRKGGDARRILAWTDERSRLQRLRGVEPSYPEVTPVDAVVARSRDAASASSIATIHDARVIDTDDVHDRLLYAIDREDCLNLCGAHFDRRVEPRAIQSPESVGPAFERLYQPRALLVAVAVLCALLVAIAIGLSGPSGGPAPGQPVDPPGQGDTPTAAVTPVGGDAGDTSTPATSTSRETAAITPDDPSYLNEAWVFEQAGVTDELELQDEIALSAGTVDRLRATASRYRNASITCVKAPGELLEVATGAIRFNNESRNDGLRAVHARFVAETRPDFETFEAGITSPVYRPLFTFDRIGFESPDVTLTLDDEGNATGGTVVRRSVVVARNGTVAEYAFHLELAGEDCWKIQQIYRDRSGRASDGLTSRDGSAVPDPLARDADRFDR